MTQDYDHIVEQFKVELGSEIQRSKKEFMSTKRYNFIAEFESELVRINRFVGEKITSALSAIPGGIGDEKFEIVHESVRQINAQLQGEFRRAYIEMKVHNQEL